MDHVGEVLGYRQGDRYGALRIPRTDGILSGGDRSSVSEYRNGEKRSICRYWGSQKGNRRR